MLGSVLGFGVEFGDASMTGFSEILDSEPDAQEKASSDPIQGLSCLGEPGSFPKLGYPDINPNVV